MPLRVGFDLDGVLADMDRELIRHAGLLFNPSPGSPAIEDDVDNEDPDGPEPAPPAQLSLTARQQKVLWRHVRRIENFWEQLSEIEEGMIARIAGLSRVRLWEPIFLTSRPSSAGDTTQLQTQRWLQARGFPMPSVYVVRGSRGAVAAALDLDAVIDDRVENCMDIVADSKARAILVWRGGSSPRPAAVKRLGIAVVASTAECLDTLLQLESAAMDRPGPLDRVKRLLGLKEPALD